MAQSSSSSGIGFVGLLTIVLITLKLTGFIKWSWWWVLSPILLCFISTIIILIGILIFTIIQEKNKRKLK